MTDSRETIHAVEQVLPADQMLAVGLHYVLVYERIKRYGRLAI